MTHRVVQLDSELAKIEQPWTPKIVEELNDSHVKIARFEGEFDWHHHETEDEMFMVLRGRIQIQFDDGDIELNEGELTVVRRGIRHRPVALTESADVLLFEPASTRNTGNLKNERTVESPERI